MHCLDTPSSFPSHPHFSFPSPSVQCLPQGSATSLWICYQGCLQQRPRSAIPLTVSHPTATRNNTERRGLLGPQRNPGPGGFFNRAHGFTLNNTAVTSVIGDNNTVTYVQGDRNLVSHGAQYHVPFHAIASHIAVV
jgi:hypothetical protein